MSPAIEKHAPGMFCWIELATTDAEDAKRFYGGLFGWQPNDLPMGPGSFYTLLQIGGQDVAALYPMDESMRRQGITPHWMEYIAVDDADSATERARALGATVLNGPFDVFESGRMTALRDPAGAVFSIWQAKQHMGIRLAGVPNTLCWSELATRDKAGALEFYRAMFGWEMKQSDLSPVDYTEIYHGGAPIGGVLEIAPEWGDAPPQWMPYFRVENCDAAAAKVGELGGDVKHEPMDIPGVGRFAVIADPQGAVSSIIQLIGM